jgi:hypothetical protein
MQAGMVRGAGQKVYVRDVVAGVEQFRYQERPEETGSAGHEHPCHLCLFPYRGE